MMETARGEKVYSIAVSLLEFLGDKAAQTPVQSFAKDIRGSAISLEDLSRKHHDRCDPGPPATFLCQGRPAVLASTRQQHRGP
jgi:hypothetical protein